MRFYSYLFVILFFANTPIFAQDVQIQEIIDEAEDLRYDGDYQAAINKLQKALRQYKDDPNIADTSIAKIHHKLSVNYYIIDKFQDAINAVDQAIAIRQSSLEEGHPDLANSFFLRGAINRYTGSFVEAHKDINASILTFEQNTSLPPIIVDSILADYYLEMGSVSYDLGDFYQSILLWDKSQQYFLQKYGPLHDEYAFTHDRKGIAYQKLKRYDLAMRHLKEGERILEALPSPRMDMLAGVYTDIARTHLEMGEFDQAKNYFYKSFSIYKAIDEQTEICNSYANLIEVYQYMEEYEEAYRAFSKGIKLALQLYEPPYHPTVAELYTNIGKVACDQQDYEQALQYFQQAIESLVTDISPAHPQGNPSPSQDYIGQKADLIIPLALKANTLAVQANEKANSADLFTALETYKVIDTLVVLLRQSLKTGESKYALHRQLVPIYENAISTALRFFETEQDSAYLELAYSFAARNKAIILLEGRQDEKAKTQAGIPDSLIFYENQLKQQYYETERVLYEMSSSGDLATFQSKKLELFETKRAYDRLIETIEANYPEYYQKKYIFLKTPHSKEIRAKLSSDRAVLEFFVGTKNIFLFTLTSAGFDYQRISKPANFNQTCIQLRRVLSEDQPSQESIRGFTQSASQLYQWLLQECLNNLPNSVKRLCIIPDDILLQISFDVLLQQKVEDWRGSNLPYLISDYAISYVYSNKLLFEADQTSRTVPNNQKFAGFGLEYNEFTLEGLSLLDTVTQDRSLTEALRSVGKLLYSDDEVLEISSLLNGQAWVNQKATKQAFLRYANEFGILHLAMHGLVDEDQPMNSALIFSRTSDSLDYFLYASDIYNLQLPKTQMVVLSACNTGYGQLTRGEGIRSLARAFAYAGSPSLVATFWSAPDKPTKDIMLLFYAGLKVGLPKDIALQQAKLEYLQQSTQEYTAPPYWAHLLVAGEVAPIFDHNRWPKYFWLFLGFGAVLISALIYRMVTARSNRRV